MGCAVAGIPGRRRGVQGPPPRVNSGRPVVSARTGMRSGFARPPAFLVLSRARLGQVLPDAALAPVAVAVPQLVGAHVLIARRCKTIQGFEAMRASPLILAITGFGLGVKHLNTCTCISACGLRASAYGVRAHMYARTHTGHGNNFGSLVARQGELSAVFSASRDNGHLAFGLFLGDPRRCPSCARLRLHPHTHGPRRERQDRGGGIICVTTSGLAMISLVLAPSILSALPAPGSREFELLPFRRVCHSSP
jgi:hypothetical protein